MILKIELENQNFLEVEFEDNTYIVGFNQKQLWKVFRSLYYYFNKDPKLTENIYGDNKIEVLLDDNIISVKNNEVYFINSRDSIYSQMLYKKDSLLFELLNSLNDDFEIDRSIENINNEQLKLEIAVQNLLKQYSNNLTSEFQDNTYMDYLKNNLIMEYEADGKSYPLEFMDTETLLDEYLNFLEFKLKDNAKPIWVVLYNLDSFISISDKEVFLTDLRKLSDKGDLRIIYLGNNLKSVPLTENEIGNIVIAADDFHQLLPYDELLKSIKMHYPNEFNLGKDEFISSLKRVVPYVGNGQNMYLSNKDLVLLKVVNNILGYKTLYDHNINLLTDAETEFLKD